MKYEELRQLILEELFANQTWKQKWYKGDMLGPFDVYKNPPSIRKFGEGIRAFTVPNGDLYIVDSFEIIHHDIVNYLGEHEGYNIDPGLSYYWDSGLNKKYMGWVKKEKNILNLSESTNWGYFENYYKTDLGFREYIKKLQTKHPKIVFELKVIGDIEELDNIE